MPELETLLSKMYSVLDKKYGLNAEKVFGLFDYKDTGMSTIPEFKKVINNMFDSVVTTQDHIDLLLRLMPEKGSDG